MIYPWIFYRTLHLGKTYLSDSNVCNSPTEKENRNRERQRVREREKERDEVKKAGKKISIFIYPLSTHITISLFSNCTKYIPIVLYNIYISKILASVTEGVPCLLVGLVVIRSL